MHVKRFLLDKIFKLNTHGFSLKTESQTIKRYSSLLFTPWRGCAYAVCARITFAHVVGRIALAVRMGFCNRWSACRSVNLITVGVGSGRVGVPAISERRKVMITWWLLSLPRMITWNAITLIRRSIGRQRYYNCYRNDNTTHTWYIDCSRTTTWKRVRSIITAIRHVVKLYACRFARM